MGVEPHEGGLALYGARRVEDVPASGRICPAGFQIGQHPAGSLEAQNRYPLEACLAHLVLEFPGQVEEGRGEVVPLGRIPVLPVPQVPRHDGRIVRISQKIVDDAVEQGGKAPHRRRHEKPARLEHAARLPERLDPLRPLGQMVERTQQQHCFHARVGLVEPAGIA